MFFKLIEIKYFFSSDFISYKSDFLQLLVNPHRTMLSLSLDFAQRALYGWDSGWWPSWRSNCFFLSGASLGQDKKIVE